jgi:hypothetical protein
MPGFANICLCTYVDMHLALLHSCTDMHLGTHVRTAGKRSPDQFLFSGDMMALAGVSPKLYCGVAFAFPHIAWLDLLATGVGSAMQDADGDFHFNGQYRRAWHTDTSDTSDTLHIDILTHIYTHMRTRAVEPRVCRCGSCGARLWAAPLLPPERRGRHGLPLCKDPRRHVPPRLRPLPLHRRPQPVREREAGRGRAHTHTHTHLQTKKQNKKGCGSFTRQRRMLQLGCRVRGRRLWPSLRPSAHGSM